MPANKSANEALAGLAKGSDKLGLVMGGKNVKPGQYVPRAGASSRSRIHSHSKV